MPDVTLRRVGHKGADHIAPGNTPASFDAALAAGVDMIEFDVLPRIPDAPGTTPLVLAHDYAHAGARRADARGGPRPPGRRPRSPTSSSTSTSSCPATRTASSTALREHGLVERTLVSTMYMRSLVDPARARAAAAPRLVGAARQARLHAVALLHAGPAYGAACVYGRGGCPRDRRRPSRAGRCDALMAHWRLVTPRLVEARRATPAASSTSGRSTTPRASAARGARRDGRHHERPAPVRRRLR